MLSLTCASRFSEFAIAMRPAKTDSCSKIWLPMSSTASMTAIMVLAGGMLATGSSVKLCKCQRHAGGEGGGVGWSGERDEPCAQCQFEEKEDMISHLICRPLVP